MVRLAHEHQAVCRQAKGKSPTFRRRSSRVPAVHRHGPRGWSGRKPGGVRSGVREGGGATQATNDPTEAAALIVSRKAPTRATEVAAIPAEPEIPEGYSQWEAAAYREGWNTADAKSPRHARRTYPTDGEREAFNCGWDARSNLVLRDDLL